MSARVFNPLVLSEMRRMIGRSNSDASPAAVNSVRRDLFGPIDHEEAQAFVDKELAALRKRQNETWGFDFEKESPIDNARFRWERFDPEAYNLRITSLVGQNNEDQPAKDTETKTTITPAVEDQTSPNIKTTVKQSQITDFMKCRKRSLSVDDISRRKVGNLMEGDVSSTEVGSTAFLSKPSKNKRSRTRQVQ